ncbi:MAG: hypothetical protein HS104_37565 [Polyangiaceae bacterium]|nr:hypothetical protein [Polyangiaceae bacterium]MCE7891976.1 hypothetical protein [Sorangiineae bacterium PRO1]MCL4749959.1 hypothetical protein [Myxococcales bacterium]
MKAPLPIGLGLAMLGCNASSAPPPAGAGPGKVCTEMGCQSGLDIELVRPTGWPPGSYRITLRVDGKSASCEGKLPLEPCERGPTFHCNDASLSIAESGCALAADQHAIGGLTSTVTEASKASLVIEHQGALQATAQLTPAFQTVQPNGPGCEPVCQSASMRLTLR